MNFFNTYKRNRILYFFLIILVIFLGLASRRYSSDLPAWAATNAGDVLWALMVFLGFGFVFKSSSTLKAAVLAITFSYAIEISQLYHAPWINAVRHNPLGGLILGYGFLWSDLLCYLIGIVIGVLIEGIIRYKTSF